MKRSRLTRKRLIWTGLGVAAWVLALIGKQFPNGVDIVYGSYVYPAIRWLFGNTLSQLPIPAIWIVFTALLVLLFFTAIMPLKRNSWSGTTALGGLISTLGGMVFLFYILWGYNYQRPDVKTRLGLDTPPLDSTALTQAYDRATERVTRWITEHEQTLRTQQGILPETMEAEVRQALNEVLKTMDYPLAGNVKGRLLKPKGVLLSFNTAGIYIPFSGEGHVDAGLLPVQIPFTLAHELAHGQGVTNEGECNFLAYLACRASDDPYIRYSGLISYWRYVASDYRRAWPERYAEQYVQLPSFLRTTLREIAENNKRYPEILPSVRDAVYDSYLKSQGVHDGLLSYSTVVRMVNAYEGQLSRQ